MPRITRLVGILLSLQKGHSRTADQIAEEFRISRRTVFRDIQTLRRAGIDIAISKSGRYRLAHVDGKMRDSELNVLEMVSLALLRREVTTKKSSSYAQAVMSAIAKTISKAPPSCRERASALIKRAQKLLVSRNPSSEVWFDMAAKLLDTKAPMEHKSTVSTIPRMQN